MSDDIFAPIFIPDELVAASGGQAWLSALLRAEVALAAAEARCLVIPSEAAEAIAAAAEDFAGSPAEVGRRGKGVGNPAAGLVSLFTAHVAESDPEAAKYVHLGATSQDIVDTAAMLVAADLLALMENHLRALGERIASVIADHGDDVIAGRTLLQQALPMTIGTKAAGWLSAVIDAIEDVAVVRRRDLAAQLGGAVGTLASLGEAGMPVAAAFAVELGLVDPDVPWHTNRTRIAHIGAVAALTSGVVGKVAHDLILLAQTEVDEFNAGGAGGGSSTMPHKRNPIGAVAARACTLQVPGLVSTLHVSMAHEHERAAGAWHAEWKPLTECLTLAGASVANLIDEFDNGEFHGAGIEHNLDLTHGLMMAERVTTRLTAAMGRLEAHHLMQRVSLEAARRGLPLRDLLLAQREIMTHLTIDEIDDLLAPDGYLGSAQIITERVLRRWRTIQEGGTSV